MVVFKLMMDQLVFLGAAVAAGLAAVAVLAVLAVLAGLAGEGVVCARLSPVKTNNKLTIRTILFMF